MSVTKTIPRSYRTFGCVTKANRFAAGISKDHHLDACVIASGLNPITIKTNLLYLKKSVPKGDYQQSKGIHSEQSIITGKICGFRKFDKVKYFGKEYFIKGRMSTGYAILMDIDANKIDFSTMSKGYKTPKLSNCKRIASRKTVLCTQVVI